MLWQGHADRARHHSTRDVKAPARHRLERASQLSPRYGFDAPRSTLRGMTSTRDLARRASAHVAFDEGVDLAPHRGRDQVASPPLARRKRRGRDALVHEELQPRRVPPPSGPRRSDRLLHASARAARIRRVVCYQQRARRDAAQRVLRVEALDQPRQQLVPRVAHARRLGWNTTLAAHLVKEGLQRADTSVPALLPHRVAEALHSDCRRGRAHALIHRRPVPHLHEVVFTSLGRISALG
mmetsp:Transcript_57078/g.131045  ORF Transcript_57078/g.131045 Transcript_57078/m.131045 type:complete len:239 (-) Transcript_57078:272-988(-)